MIDKKDAADLFGILTAFTGYNGQQVERIVELKAKLKAIAEAKEEPCLPTT